MSVAPADRLVHMANQIAAFFASQPGDAALSIAEHLRAFWDPRMREDLLRHCRGGGAGLHPLAASALQHLDPPRAP